MFVALGVPWHEYEPKRGPDKKNRVGPKFPMFAAHIFCVEESDSVISNFGRRRIMALFS
jgi:hypothetical protein